MVRTIVVLAGGNSPEREVSLRSGAAVARGLEKRGVKVKILDPVEPDFIQKLLAIKDIYAVFIALHGCGGEDGTIQGFLETLGIPYTGSGVLASAVALDKFLSKKLFLAAGIPVPAFCPPFTFPLVVKPARGGSTIGVSIVEKMEDLEAAVQSARKYDNRVLMEEFIAGNEITVSILGNDQPRILPTIQILSPGGFYDYQAKYTPTEVNI